MGPVARRPRSRARAWTRHSRCLRAWSYRYATSNAGRAALDSATDRWRRRCAHAPGRPVFFVRPRRVFFSPSLSISTNVLRASGTTVRVGSGGFRGLAVSGAAYEPIVIVVRADPVPNEYPGFNFIGQRSVTASDPDRPGPAQPLEMKRRVPRILFQKRVLLVRQFADTGW